MATSELRDVQEVRLLRQSRYCRSCQTTTSPFEGTECPTCTKRAARRSRNDARQYVADYFRDHPMQIPRAMLRRMQDSTG